MLWYGMIANLKALFLNKRLLPCRILTDLVEDSVDGDFSIQQRLYFVNHQGWLYDDRKGLSYFFYQRCFIVESTEVNH